MSYLNIKPECKLCGSTTVYGAVVVIDNTSCVCSNCKIIIDNSPVAIVENGEITKKV